MKEGFRTESHILDRLQEAISDNRQVALTYRRPEQESPSMEIMDPYTLFFRRRAIYVEGYSWSESGIRVYRLSRISEVRFRSKGFAVRSDYDFGKRYRNAFSAFPGDTTRHVVVRFDARTRPYITETTWHHSQKITPLPDGGIRFEVDVAEPREVMWWSFFWGAGAEILSPEWLREAAREEVARMADNYR